MIAYLLKVSLCWLFFYGIYELFLKKRTFFNANRSYLLSTLILGIVLPLLEFIPWKTETNVAHVVYPVLIEIDELQQFAVQNSSPNWSWISILTFIYAAGLIVSFTRFIFGVNKIVDLYRNSEKLDYNGFTMVLTDKFHLPFSFFKWVFFSKKIKFTEEIEQVMEHELEHIKGRHSFDILLTEIIKVIFWCSPLIYFYKNALKEVHEYLADQIVVNKTDKLSYKKLLIQHTGGGLQMALTHQFFNSHLKNRLKMINQKRSGRPTLVMYALGIPVLLILLFAFTYSFSADEQQSGDIVESLLQRIDNTEEVNSESTPEIARRIIERFNSNSVLDTVPLKNDIAVEGEIFKVVEQMPRFPGCDESTDNAEDCAKQKMLEYIYGNLVYPSEARKAGTEGMAVAQFVVTKNGDIADINIMRSLGNGCDEAVLKVLNSMNYMDSKWIPGVQRGRKVNVLYTLPVRFKLGDNEKRETEKVVPTSTISEANTDREVFKVVEEMPVFPGCDMPDMDDADKQACTKENLLKYIYTNIKYPKEAREAGIEGMSVVQYVITKEGRVEDVKVVRDIGGNTGSSAISVVEGMNNLEERWTPGVQRGKKVDVLYTLPIRFKLEGDLAKKSIHKEIEVDKSADPGVVLDEMVVVGYADKKKVKLNAFDFEKPKLVTTEGLVIKEDQNGFNIKGKGYNFASDYKSSNDYPAVFVDGKMWTRGLKDINPKDYIAMSYQAANDKDKVSWTIGFYSEKEVISDKYKEVYVEGFSSSTYKAKEVVKIKGKVTDSNGNPLIGANVIIKSTTSGTITDFDGQYALAVNKGDVVVYSYIGKKAKAEVIGNEHVVNVVLEDGENEVEQIEVRGKGSMFNNEDWHPLYIVDGDEVSEEETAKIDEASILSINVYKGEHATEKFGDKGKDGVIEIITKNNDNVIKEKPSVVVRSQNNSDEPIYVINGKVQDRINIKEDINPDDIKSINVLKGEKAIAIYGERAENGVIEITTKDLPVVSGFRKIADAPAYFPGCTDVADPEEKQQCSNANLVSYIANNLRYPQKAKQNGTEGVVLIKFDINKNGQIANAKIAKNLPDGLGEAALTIIQQMNDNGVQWESAIKNGKAVSSEFTLPVKFKLPIDNKEHKDVLTDKKLEVKNFNVYPNPNDGIFNLKFETAPGSVSIQVFDVIGKQVYRQDISDFNGKYNDQIELKNTNDNIYIIRVVQDGASYSTKILKN